MVINHLLTGMILQVLPQTTSDVFYTWKNGVWIFPFGGPFQPHFHGRRLRGFEKIQEIVTQSQQCAEIRRL